MTLPDLSDALVRWAPRMRANGVDPGDLDRARSRARNSWERWYEVMADLGDGYAALAWAAQAAGRALSAGEHWVRAGLTYHFAQFALGDFPELQASGQRKKVAAFAAAAPLCRPPLERLEVRYGKERLPVLLRRPPGPGPHPWVLLVAGLDSAKEEGFTLGQLCLARGLAVAACDGPGQGEVAAAGRPWRPGDEAAVDWVREALSEVPGLDPGRCGLLGVSFGGYLATAAACMAGEAVRACAAVGGCFSLGGPEWQRLPPRIQADWAHFTGAGSPAEAAALAKQVSLAERLAHLSCPLLLFHGDQDGVFPDDHARRCAGFAGERAELHLLPGGGPACDNLPHQFRPYTADWFAERL